MCASFFHSVFRFCSIINDNWYIFSHCYNFKFDLLFAEKTFFWVLPFLYSASFLIQLNFVSLLFFVPLSLHINSTSKSAEINLWAWLLFFFVFLHFHCSRKLHLAKFHFNYLRFSNLFFRFGLFDLFRSASTLYFIAFIVITVWVCRLCLRQWHWTMAAAFNYTIEPETLKQTSENEYIMWYPHHTLSPSFSCETIRFIENA